jgi:hypothetical protein
MVNNHKLKTRNYILFSPGQQPVNYCLIHPSYDLGFKNYDVGF